MLNSGTLQKGDIIMMNPTSWENDDMWTNDGKDDHVGFYWGDGHSDLMFHASAHGNGIVEGRAPGTMISQITPKYEPSVYYVIHVDHPIGSVETYKKSSDSSITDGNSAYSLAGAQYNFYKGGVDYYEFAGLMTTDENGYATTDLAPGWYWCHEVKASPGFTIDYTGGVRGPDWYYEKVGDGTFDWARYDDNGWYKVLIEANKTTYLQKDDTMLKNVYEIPETTTIKLQKTDAQTGRDVAKRGFTFTIYGPNSSTKIFKSGVVTDANGSVTIEDVPFGTYYIKETKTVAPYLLNTEVIRINLNSTSNAGKTIKVEFENDKPRSGDLTVYKQDKQGNPIRIENGFTFVLQQGGVTKYTASTNSSGIAYFTNIKFGTYTLKETTAQAPWLVSTRTVSVSFDEYNPSETIYFENEKLTGEITVEKLDDGTGEPVVGAKFEVTAAENITRQGESSPALTTGQVAGTITTGSNGTGTLGNLPIGADGSAKYKVKEISVPDPYVFETHEQTTDLVRSGNEAVVSWKTTVRDEQAKGKVNLVKKDTLGNLVANAVFKLVADENIVINEKTVYSKGDVVDGCDALTTDSNGEIHVEDLPIGNDGDGKYRFIEVSAPAPYVATQEYPFTLTRDGNEAEVTTDTINAVNDIATAKVKLVKYDKDQPEVMVQGAEFDLYVMDDVQLPNGDYLAHAGDKINDESLVTDENGEITVEGLYLDGDGTTYEFRETDVPSPYMKDFTPHPFTVTYKDVSTLVIEANVTVENEQVKGRGCLTKVDDVFGQPVEGAVFAVQPREDIIVNGEVKWKAGEEVDRVTTDEDGYAETKNLFISENGWGRYKFVEVSVPAPYLLNQTEWNFDIEFEDVQEPIKVYVDANDGIATGEASLAKTDDEFNEPIEGAVFDVIACEDIDILDEDGNYVVKDGDKVGTVTTDESGEASIDGLYIGKDGDGQYKFVEVSVPEPYVISNKETPFTLTYEDMNTEVVYSDSDIKNDVAKGQAELTKTDVETGRVLEGAEFDVIAHEDIEYPNGTIKVHNGDVVDHIVTDAEGKAITKELYIGADGDGKYAFVETKPPVGYNPDASDVPFTLTYDQPDVALVKTSVSKTNKPIRGDVEMPKIDTELSKFKGEEDKTGNPQGDGVVSGTVFEIVTNNDYPVLVGGTIHNKGDVVIEITTDENGIAKTTGKALPYGSYTLREKTPPTGYLGTDETWDFNIEVEGEVVKPETIDDRIDNQIIHGDVEMPKIDREIAAYDGEDTTGNPQGNATLEGTEFTIKNKSAHHVKVDDVLYDSGDDVCKITTDKDGFASTTGKKLPYGTYELRETKAPTGYNLTSEVWTFTIREDGEVAKPKKVEEKIDDIVIRGGVKMPKVDAMLASAGYDEDKLIGQDTGDATLDGAEFAIDNISDTHVIVGGQMYELGERIKTIPDANNDGKTSDVIKTVDGVAKTTANALPYGTYEIYEVKAPDGYELSSERYTFHIIKEGVIVNPQEGTDDAVVSDVPTSSQVEGEKADKDIIRTNDESAEQPVIDDDADDTEDDAGNENTDDSNDGSGNENDEAQVAILADGDISDADNSDASSAITDPSAEIDDIGLDKNPLTNAQGDATLEGAEFYLMNRSKNMVVVGGKIYQPDERITTIPLPDGTYGDVVTSDATGHIAFGDEGLPYGTYELGEQTPPEGYNLSDDTYIIEVRGKSGDAAIDPDEYVKNPTATNDETVKPEKAEDAIEDTVITGGLSVQKVDKESGRGDVTVNRTDDDVEASDDDSEEAADETADSQSDEEAASADDASSDDSETDASGEAKKVNPSLAGTMFEIRNASGKAVIVDGKIYQVGQVVKTITTDATGYAATEADALPYGTYDVYEVDAPLGYLSSADSYGDSNGTDDTDEKTYVQTVEIREQGVIVPCARPFANQVKRGDITFTKIDDDGNPMAHVAFKVTNKTTGESHIIVTDENGVYNSSSSVIPHSQNTNANDGAFDKNGNIDDSKLVYDAGTWFYGNADGKAFAGDGTLPNNVDRFGLVSDGNITDEGDSDNVESDDADIDADDATDVDDSEAVDDDASDDGGMALVLGDDIESGSGSSTGSSSEPVRIPPVYEVTSEDGMPKQVTIGHVDTDTNGSFENNNVVFNSDGSITIVYDKTIVDSNTGEKRSYTSYETYADGSWKVLVIGSAALGGENENGYVDADGNGEYDIIDNPDAYTTSAQYPMGVPDDNLGAFPYGEYVFEELPSKATEGRNLVAFEATIERHNYLLNLGPITDNIIDIHTTATDQADGDQILDTNGTVTIVDTVEYTNLNTDREYTMTGTLMDYETGEPMKDGNGNAITSSVTFTPSTPNGSVDIVFEIDATQLGGVQTVVFEDLYWNNIHIASHADIEDDNQRVEFHPEIGTTAVGEGTNDHFAYADGSVIIVDTVHYKGVVPGREFIVHGILMDKNTGDALVDANGNTVENSVVFTPDTSEGDIEVRFEFDASTLAGLDVVVFENLYRIDIVTNRTPGENDDDIDDEVLTKQRLVASHADINDEGQTVSIRANGLASDQFASDLVQTGAMIGLGIVGAAAVGGTAYAINKKRKQRNAMR